MSVPTLPSDDDDAIHLPLQPPQPFDVPQALHVLAFGDAQLVQGLLRWSSNHTFLLSLTQGDQHVMAIYKPQRGERPLWDFPDGTLCYRELAAYAVSQALNWDLVPPTVIRDGPRGIGSVQYFIDHNPEINYFSFTERHHDQLRRMVAFDYIINNADRKGGHCLLDAHDHIWGIDHGIGFHTAPKLRTVIWDFAGQLIPVPILDDLQCLLDQFNQPASPLMRTLSRLLHDTELAAFGVRLRRLIQRAEYPRPGPGPNYPWPPV